MPRQWYNILPDMPNGMLPPLHPGTGQPVGPDDLAPIFPMNLIEQEVSPQRWIDIPEPILEKYAYYRPSPLGRAYSLEQYLQTPAKIYFKNEGVSPAGSHKPNTAIAQAYYNKVFGTKRISTETGAGQWGSAMSYAGALFGLEVKVYMVRISLVVMRKPGTQATREEILAHFEGKVAKWQVPDDVEFVDAIPLGATGKMQKNKLREQFKGHRLPGA